MSDRTMDRRLFLGGSAAALGYFFTADALSAVRAADNPSSKLRVAGIGVGGKGASDIDGASKVMDVVAVCDCDRGTLGKSGEKFKVPANMQFTDFRKLFDDAIAKTYDALTISTPDHTHTWPAVTGMRMKKHVYVQKPLTHSVFEARLMRETAKKFGVCGQMGNQGSAENGLRRAVELVQEGILGKVTEIHVWTNRPVWPQAPDVMKRPPAEDPPATVDWEAFIGPAPMRPYAKGAYHTFKWRGWLDFGTGALGDMACHTANMAFRACELTSPTTIEADATDVNDETFPSSAKIKYAFPARGDKPHQAALNFFWYEGKRGGKKVLPSEELLKKVLPDGGKLADSGSIIVGDKAILFSPNDYGAQFRILAGTEELAKGDRTPKVLPVNGKGDNGMKEEWARAIREGKPEIAYSNFDIAGMLTEAILLGNVAIRAGKKIEFDAAKLKVTNDEAANRFIKREYRKGWELSDRA
ncbi:MAG TPA: Gfo/Idh/MocA family oxidoreductase [Gemmataceae bacterium]|jgi:predicted dehydrogenase|nr:Gfo/Idh/MocA family oxidoreductase [Gemmataceae bacterium]